MLSYIASALLAVSAIASEASYLKAGADWGTLETDNASWRLCQTGKHQSPIDLTTTDATISEKMEVRGVNYYDVNQAQIDWSSEGDKSMAVMLTGRAGVYDTTAAQDALTASATNSELQLTYDDGSKSFFEPTAFNFHSPSEHTVDGKAYDLEMQIAHVVKGSYDANGTPLLGAMISVFFDVAESKDTKNVFIDSLVATKEIAFINKNAPMASFRSTDKSNIGIRTFLGNMDMGDFWSYEGSLTTPPCTEGIQWSVMKQVQSLSANQLKAIQMAMDLETEDHDHAEGEVHEEKASGSARKTQFLNDRTLYYSGAGSLVAGTAAAMAAIAALTF